MSPCLAQFMMALEFHAGLAEVTAPVLSHNSNSMQETPQSGDWRERDRWIQFTNNLALCMGSSQKSCYWKVTTHSGGPKIAMGKTLLKGNLTEGSLGLEFGSAVRSACYSCTRLGFDSQH